MITRLILQASSCFLVAFLVLVIGAIVRTTWITDSFPLCQTFHLIYRAVELATVVIITYPMRQVDTKNTSSSDIQSIEMTRKSVDSLASIELRDTNNK